MWLTKIRLGLALMMGFVLIIMVNAILGSHSAAATSIFMDATTNPPTSTPWPTPTVVPPQGGVIVSVKPPGRYVSLTQMFTVAIKIETAQVTRGSSFALKFDPTVLQCEAVNEGTFYSNWAQSHGASTLVYPQGVCNNISGTLSEMGITLLGGSGGPTGQGTLANIRFHGVAEGTSLISLTKVIVVDSCSPTCQPLTTTLNNAQIQVGSAAVSVNAPASPVLASQVFTASIGINTNVLATRGFQFGLKFDPAIIHCEAVSEGTFYSNWAQSHGASTIVFYVSPYCNNISGTLSVMGISVIGAGGQGGPTGTGTVANVRFHGLAVGTSLLSLTEVQVTDDCLDGPCRALPITLSDGQVRVKPEYLVCLPVVLK